MTSLLHARAAPRPLTLTAGRNFQHAGRRILVTRAAAQTEQNALRLEVPTKAVQAGVRFATVPRGRGVAVVVQRVLPGPLLEAGLAPGQQLLAISDPIQPSQVWPLTDNASLRYVNQAVRMRSSPTLTLVLSPDPLVPDFEAAAEVARAAASGAGAGAQQPAGQAGAGDDMTLLDALAASLEAPAEPRQGPAGGAQSAEGAAGAAPTLAERVEELSREQERQLTAFKRRVKKRKDYMEQVSQRNDANFFLGLLGAFLGPAAIGLALAFSSGYIDTLTALY